MSRLYFGMVCVEDELFSRDFISKAKLTVIKEVNYETYVGGDSFELEHSVAKDLLLRGNGIVHKGKVIFLEKNLQKNSKYHLYLRVRGEKIRKYKTYLHGALIKELPSLKLFPIVKSVLQLYSAGIITKDKASQELSKYLPQGSIFSLLDENIIEMAG